jgi:hypothetical protein
MEEAQSVVLGGSVSSLVDVAVILKIIALSHFFELQLTGI